MAITRYSALRADPMNSPNVLFSVSIVFTAVYFTLVQPSVVEKCIRFTISTRSMVRFVLKSVLVEHCLEGFACVG